MTPGMSSFLHYSAYSNWSLATYPFFSSSEVFAMLNQGSTLNFEGTCQEGQVNFNFYLPDAIVTYLAKGAIE